MSIILSLIYPIGIFLTLKYFQINLNDAIYFKMVPLLMSLYFTWLIAISYIQKNSLIIKFAKKLSKIDLSSQEEEYIHKSTLFWLCISFVNIFLHVVTLLNRHEYYWLIYTTFGWYFVFIFAGILQYLHRKFVFLKKVGRV